MADLRRLTITGGEVRRADRSRRRAARSGRARFWAGLESLEQRTVLTFLPPVSFPVGASPMGVAVADFNADGKSDLAVANYGVASTVGIMLSNGDSTFQPKVDYGAGAYAADVRAGDFNADGKADLAVVGNGTGTVNLLLGNGDGSFGAPVSYTAGVGARALVLGDFNNDAKLDVATMNSGTASVLLGNGDGTLQARVDAPFVGNTNLIAGDYNKDGNLDLVTSNTNSLGTITLIKGHGDGSFDPAMNIYANSAPVYVASGDFDHDGYDDFAVANSYAATSMSVIHNNGDGTYGSPNLYSIPQTGYEIEIEDFNNDGHDDIAVRGASQYMVEYGKGDGSFYASLNFTTPTGQFQKGSQHGDFNGDGAVDLAYVSNLGITVVMNANDTAVTQAGAVAFRLNTPASTTAGAAMPMTITALDANGDPATGFRGTVFVTTNDPAVTSTYTYTFTAADAGTHAFSGLVRLQTPGTQTITVASPLMTSATASVNVLPGVSRFVFDAPAASRAGDTFNVTVTAVDSAGGIGTGYTSTVHFASSDTLAGLPSDYTFTPEDAGVHTFAVTLKTAGSKFVSATEVGGRATGGAFVNVSPLAATSFTLAGSGGSIGVARPVTILARDPFGNTDTSYAGTVHFTSSDPLAVLPADTTLSNGAATASVTFLTVGTQTLTATDVANSALTGTMTSDATPPIPSRFSVSGYPATTAGDAHTFTVTVLDTIGQVATGYRGTVYFSSSDVKAGLPSSYTFTAADGGVHTFSATLKTAGTQSISVTDYAGLSGTQVGISVGAAAFGSLQLTVPNPTDSKGHILLTAGDLVLLTVKATDIYGNAADNYNGTVHFTSTDTQAVLPADYTFTPADGGVHTFTVSLLTNTANGEVWSITGTDVADASATGTVTNFEVVNAAASVFTIAIPTQIVAGSPIDVKVSAHDAYGNAAKNYFGTVHFTSTGGAAGLPEDYTFTSEDASDHTFSVTLFKAGDLNLTVTDVNDAALTTGGVATVKPAAASGLAIAYPAATTAGVAQTVTVTAIDPYGNTAPDYIGTVAFSSSDVQAGLPATYTFRNNDKGVQTFALTLKTAGSHSVTVTDTANASATATQSSVAVSPSSAAGSFVVSGFPATAAGTAQSFTVAVKDPYGNFTNTYTGTVSFSSSDAQAGLPSSYTFTAADAGVHTFSATLKTLGTQSISVRDAANASAVGTQSGIVVSSAAQLGSFTVSGFPATTAGVAQSFTVRARDIFGNVMTGYTGTVVFSSSDVKAGLPSSYTFTAADAGVHTFSATLKTAGSQSITVKDAASPLILGTQTGIAVTAAAAARFQISAPATVTQNVSFNLTLTVLDAFGNVATGYLGKVNLSSTDSKAGSTKYSFSSRDNGVHVFSYKFGTLGLQTITLVDTANSLIVGTINVNVVAK